MEWQDMTPLQKTVDLLSFYEGSVETLDGVSNPVVIVNAEDFATILENARAALPTPPEDGHE